MSGNNGKEEGRDFLKDKLAVRNKEGGKRMRKRGRMNRMSNRIKVRKSIMTTLMWGGDRGQWVLSNQ